MKKTLLFLLFIFNNLQAQTGLSWYQSYKGTIDKYPITVHLHKMGEALQGYYYYDSKQEPIAVSGSQNPKTLVISLQAELKTEGIEEFTLNINKEGLTGFWTNKVKRLAVTLKKNVITTTSFDFIFTEGETKLKPAMKESPIATFKMASVWPTASPQLEAIKQIIRKSFDEFKSNEDIGKLFLKQKKVYFDEYLKEKPSDQDLKDMGASYNRANDATLLVMFQSERIVTFANMGYTFEGGAHGNYATAYISVNLSNGKVLKTNDVLTAEGIKQLPKLLEKSFRRTYNIKANETLISAGLFESTIKPTDNIFVTDKGIGFGYPPYEIGPYAMGQLDLFIPFAELNQWLMPSVKK
jgi:Protein of unknown function (DUF3298)